MLLNRNYAYDALGNLIAVVQDANGFGYRTEYDYDEQSNRTVQRDALGRETTWAYDKLSRVVSRALPLGQVETLTYDAAGNRIGRIDFNGAASTFEFDVNNRETRAEYADGEVIILTYAANGRMDRVTDSRGVTDYSYDERDRLTRVEHPNGDVIEYAYDAVGNRVGLITAHQAVSYGFDALNRLSTVNDGTGTTAYGYNPVGNREFVNHANGTRTDYAYDKRNRLIDLTHRDALGTPFSRQTYTRADTGHKISVTELDGRSVDYTYDRLYRLTEERATDTARGDRTTNWTFDAVGNRLTQIDNGIVTSYTYDANDRLLEENGPDGIVTYRYDENGNTLDKRIDGIVDTIYTYDSQDRLIQADTPTATLNYAYDAMGIRQSKTENGTLTEFLVDANRQYAQVIEETRASDTITYLRGDDLISQERAGTVSTYHADGQGSTKALTDAAGNTTDRFIYTAYGEVEHREGMTDSDFLFTGEQFDAGLGFYYLRARYYNPSNGRFPTMDTYQGRVGEPQTLHKYLYVHADPVNHIDPSGMFSIGQIAVTTGIAAILANTAITSYTFAQGVRDSDGIPDGVSVSFRLGAARGLGGAVGADIVFDFRTGQLWGFGAGEFTLAPVTVFKPQRKFNIEATAGFIWNMNSPRQFNGFGSTATWPIGTAGLLARARRVSIETRGGFWGFMTQTAKFAKNRRSWSLQFGFSGLSGNGPAFVRIGRGTSFSSDFFGLSKGRLITGTRDPLVSGIERIMKQLRGSNSPDELAAAISRIEGL